MNQEIKQALINLQHELSNQSVVQKYYELDYKIKHCLTITEYERKIEEAQKSAVQSRAYHKEEAYQYWNEQADYYHECLNNHPLVLEYRQIVNEVNDLLQLVTSVITDEVNEN